MPPSLNYTPGGEDRAPRDVKPLRRGSRSRSTAIRGRCCVNVCVCVKCAADVIHHEAEAEKGERSHGRGVGVRVCAERGGREKTAAIMGPCSRRIGCTRGGNGRANGFVHI
uniref:Uncharacterized protein n=1 Tax=Knipowitschia caucasica TaxID=637954 RepID=A0AAV2IZP1_KNICA